MTALPDYLLAIETSCDDTAACIMAKDGRICADVVYSQNTEHLLFGGVVPEIASRSHLVKIAQVVAQAFTQSALKPAQIGAVAVTFGPGLIGSLLVGVQFAKGFAQSLEVPLVGVHHIEGHLFAGLLEPDFPKPPFVALIASGGHSALYLCDAELHIKTLGETRDDAAGEAFDKIAKMCGLPYPGGPHIDALAKDADASKYPLPISLRDKRVLDFSFSGIKTAARLLIASLKKQGIAIEGQVLADLCASARKAIVEALLDKAFLACQRTQVRALILGGGVAANAHLREEATRRSKEFGISVFIPPKKYCTDNAVMIACAARLKLLRGEKSGLDLSPTANISIDK